MPEVKSSSSKTTLVPNVLIPGPGVEIADGSKLKIEFKIPDVTHPTYGTVNGLKGEIDLLLPSGTFPTPNFFSLEADEAETFLNEFVIKSRNLYEELDDEALRPLILAQIAVTAYMTPTFEVHGPEFEYYLSLLLGIFKGDDITDTNEGMKNLGDLNWGNLFKKFKTGPTGENLSGREVIEKVTTAAPFLTDPLEFLLNVTERAEVRIPGLWNRLYPVLRGPSQRVLHSLPITTKKLKSGFSEDTVMYISGIEAGALPFLEINGVLSNIHVSPETRASILFRLLEDSYNKASRLLNDLLGFQKDVKEGDTTTTILRRVIAEDLSLEDAFYQTLRSCQNAVNDVAVAGDLLVSCFPDEAQLPDFVQLTKHSFDAQVYSYIAVGTIRYGKQVIKIKSA